MRNKIIEQVEAAHLKTNLPPLRIGDTVRVHTRIQEGDKERIQIFEGVLIRMKRGGIASAVTVRKVSHGIGVERIFLVHSPAIEKIEVKAHGQVRRARLYYLRDLSGKAARIVERREPQIKETTA